MFFVYMIGNIGATPATEATHWLLEINHPVRYLKFVFMRLICQIDKECFKF